MVSVQVFKYPLVVNQDQVLIEGNILQDSISQTFERFRESSNRKVCGIDYLLLGAMSTLKRVKDCM